MATTLTTGAATEPYVAAFEALAANGASAAPEWLRDTRQRGIARFTELGFPTTRQEAWRFTTVKSVVDRPFEPAPAVAVAAATLAPYGLNLGGPRLVFVNGRYDADLSEVGTLPAGAVVTNLAAAAETHGEQVRQHLERRAGGDDHPFASLNTALWQDGLFVYLQAGTVLDQPIETVFYTEAGAGDVMTTPRDLVILEANARARIVTTYAGPNGARYLTNAVSEAVVGDGGNLDWYRLQREGDAAVHIAATDSRQTDNAEYVLTPIVLGALLARHDIWMKLDGEHGTGTLNGLYVLGAKQHVDHNTIMEHAKPHCESHEYFNGILDGRSHAVFNGRIIVRPGAQKTDSKQTNNNLLLSASARADSQPQLEIYADDVRCTHGATLGPLDDDSLFYLRSRGIDADAARRLMTYGFGVEILNRVAVPAIRTKLDALITQRLREIDGEGA